MGVSYATVEEVALLGRPLTAIEMEKTEQLIMMSSALLRTEASKRGFELDAIISANDDIGLIAKSVVVSAVVRALNAMGDTSPAAVQASQSALGYSASVTYQNPGQSLYFLRNELKQLGLTQQRVGAVEVFKVYDGSDD